MTRFQYQKLICKTIQLFYQKGMRGAHIYLESIYKKEEINFDEYDFIRNIIVYLDHDLHGERVL